MTIVKRCFSCDDAPVASASAGGDEVTEYGDRRLGLVSRRGAQEQVQVQVQRELGGILVLVLVRQLRRPMRWGRFV
jgi:hypothetical protein